MAMQNDQHFPIPSSSPPIDGQAIPGLARASLWTPSRSPSPSPSPSTGRHWLKQMGDGYECVYCHQYAADFQSIHAVPCSKNPVDELEIQKAKLLRLKHLQSIQKGLETQLSETALPNTSPPNAEQPQALPPAECSSLGFQQMFSN